MAYALVHKLVEGDMLTISATEPFLALVENENLVDGKNGVNLTGIVALYLTQHDSGVRKFEYKRAVKLPFFGELYQLLWWETTLSAPVTIYVEREQIQVMQRYP